MPPTGSYPYHGQDVLIEDLVTLNVLHSIEYTLLPRSPRWFL